MSLFTEAELAPNGVPVTRGLFREVSPYVRSQHVIMTLTWNYSKLPSLFKLYVQYCVDDPSETTFALEVFGSVAHWLSIREKDWFQPYLEEYQLAADLHRKSKAFKAIVKEVEEEGRNSLAAAKFLIQEPWKEKRTKAAKERSDSTTKAARSEVDEDVKRLTELGVLKVVK